MGTLNGQGLLVTALSGINSTYARLSANKTDGLTLEDIINPDDSVNQSLLNPSFVQYLSNNFSAIDKDGDGRIKATDLTNLTTQLAQKGLTQEELVQLCSQNGNSTLLSTVMNYFHEIDKNHDGRVTNAEISAYGVEADRAKKETEYLSFNPNNFSIFYGNDESTSSYKASSILDYRYPKDTEL